MSGYRLLSWAGVRLDLEGTSLVIDAIESVGANRAMMGDPRQPMHPIGNNGDVDLAVVTHLHQDHFDAAALKARLRPPGRVICHSAIANVVQKTGLQIHPVDEWSPLSVGPFTLTAVPAVDGFGWHQVSWVVTAGQHKTIHCGDTLFHGYWWDIARRIGPVDMAFMPINGALVDLPGYYDGSGLPAALTAEQAAVAGRLLRTKVIVPIHFREFERPPTYVGDANAEANLRTFSKREGISTRIARAGEDIGW